ncbi:Hypothetical protein A7982_07059 [Minicystis rosea]|nr:Hypothetical protein A7982_07059 [Minicystis rosea]
MLSSFFSNEPARSRRLGAVALRSVHAFPDAAFGRIVGTVGVFAKEMTMAPLSGRPCVAWVVRVSGAALPSRGGPPELEVVKAMPFTVGDETGRAIVSADDETSLLLAFDVTETLGTWRKAPARLVHFLREHRSEARGIAVDWRLSWQEGILVAGQEVAVVGRGRREVDPEAAEGHYRQAATRLVMMRGGEDDVLSVSTFTAARERR